MYFMSVAATDNRTPYEKSLANKLVAIFVANPTIFRTVQKIDKSGIIDTAHLAGLSFNGIWNIANNMQQVDQNNHDLQNILAECSKLKSLLITSDDITDPNILKVPGLVNIMDNSRAIIELSGKDMLNGFDIADLKNYRIQIDGLLNNPPLSDRSTSSLLRTKLESLHDNIERQLIKQSQRQSVEDNRQYARMRDNNKAFQDDLTSVAEATDIHAALQAQKMSEDLVGHADEAIKNLSNDSFVSPKNTLDFSSKAADSAVIKKEEEKKKDAFMQSAVAGVIVLVAASIGLLIFSLAGVSIAGLGIPAMFVLAGATLGMLGIKNHRDATEKIKALTGEDQLIEASKTMFDAQTPMNDNIKRAIVKQSELLARQVGDNRSNLSAQIEGTLNPSIGPMASFGAVNRRTADDAVNRPYSAGTQLRGTLKEYGQAIKNMQQNQRTDYYNMQPRSLQYAPGPDSNLNDAYGRRTRAY